MPKMSFKNLVYFRKLLDQEISEILQDNPTNEELLELIQALQASKEENNLILTEYRSRKQERAKAWAGPYWQEMQTSFSGALGFLLHPEAQVRAAALYVMEKFKNKKEEFAEICKKVAFSDPEADVRCAALLHLANMYENSYDEAIGKFISHIICDQLRPLDERKWAYMNLLLVFGRSDDFAPIADDDSLFPSNVDWDFVKRCNGPP